MGERVKGLRKFLTRVNKIRKRHKRQIRIALEKCGTLLLSESLREVPILTGNLARTGHVRREGTGFNTVVYVGYGTDYGIYVHEDLNKAHGTAFNIKYAEQIRRSKTKGYYFYRRPTEKAKFLEDPFKRNKRRFNRIIAEELKKI